MRWKETPEIFGAVCTPCWDLVLQGWCFTPWSLQKYLSKSYFIKSLCSTLEMSAAEEGICCLRETGTQLLHEAVSAEQGSEAETFSQAGQRNFRSALEKQTDLLETPSCSDHIPARWKCPVGCRGQGVLRASFCKQDFQVRQCTAKIRTAITRGCKYSKVQLLWCKTMPATTRSEKLSQASKNWSDQQQWG